jgi:hypothetical protein
MPWTVPAIVLLIVAALRGAGGGTLAEAALYEQVRRALTPAATRSLTMSDLPAAASRPQPIEPEAKLPDPAVKVVDPSAKPAEPEPKVPELTEAEWRAKITGARSDLERDQVLAEAMQGRVNGLMTEAQNRDDPAQRADLLKQRTRAVAELDRLTSQISKDKLAIEAIEEDARRKGIPSGWIRSISELAS